MKINNNCTSCGQCFEVCESGAISFKTGRYGQAIIDERICLNCGACKEMCSSDAIDE